MSFNKIVAICRSELWAKSDNISLSPFSWCWDICWSNAVALCLTFSWLFFSSHTLLLLLASLVFLCASNVCIFLKSTITTMMMMTTTTHTICSFSFTCKCTDMNALHTHVTHNLVVYNVSTLSVELFEIRLLLPLPSLLLLLSGIWMWVCMCTGF